MDSDRVVTSSGRKKRTYKKNACVFSPKGGLYAPLNGTPEWMVYKRKRNSCHAARKRGATMSPKCMEVTKKGKKYCRIKSGKAQRRSRIRAGSARKKCPKGKKKDRKTGQCVLK